MPNSLSLAHLANELLQEVIRYLPIDENLRNLGLCSKRFFPLLYESIPLAHRHVRESLIFGFLYFYKWEKKIDSRDRADIAAAQIFKVLPLPYKIAVFYNKISHPREDIPYCENTFFYFLQQIIIPHQNYYILAREVLTNPDLFDIACQDYRIFRFAVRLGNYDTVQLLISAGKVDLTRYGDYALASACNEGHFEIVKLLLEDSCVTPNTLKAPKAKSLEMGDAEEEENEEEDEEEDEGEDEEEYEDNDGDEDYNSQIHRYATALALAASRGHLNIVKFLCNDPRLDPSEHRNMAFVMACQANQVECARFLYQIPSVREVYDPEGMALYEACKENQVEAVKFLLEDSRANPLGCFEVACGDGHVEVVKVLLEDPRTNQAATEYAGFLGACEFGHFEVVELLLSRGTIPPEVRQAAIQQNSVGFYGVGQILALLQRQW
ncbi:hypothetical protein HDU79_003246 [Rhizoclosmatium sp. JEL0117]|nr:hypothetical protein HDU79_003246 [Rhizoclosmatium sp. JEL0117]